MGVSMRLVKAFLTGAVGLFVVMTLLSLLIPSRVKVSRTTLINNTTAGKVFSEASDFNQWKNWHPVFKSTNSKIEFDPASNNGKSTSCLITYGSTSAKLSITYADSAVIKFTLKPETESAIENEIHILSIPNEANVQVEWIAINKLKWYPWEKFYGIFIDKLTGPGYDQALKGLKDYLESGH
jgi:hypothetical protein